MNHYIVKAAPGLFKVFRIWEETPVGFLKIQPSGGYNVGNRFGIVGFIPNIYAPGSVEKLDAAFSVNK